MPYNAGTAFITVAPSFKGFQVAAAAEAKKLRAIKIPVEYDMPTLPATAPGKPIKVKAELDQGAFERDVRGKLTSALRSLPKDIGLKVDSTEAEMEIASLRTQLETLSKQRIGVDLSADDALAEVAYIRAELDRLGASSPNIQVRADAAAAAAELGAVNEMVDRINGRDANVRVDANTAEADAKLDSLRAKLLALGSGVTLIHVAIAAAPMLGPLAAVAAGGAGGLAGIGAGVIGGVGAGAAVGVASIKQALDLQKKLTAASKTRVSALAGVRSAEASAASATASLSSAQVSAARGVADAERGVADARTAAARAVQTAVQSLADARRNEARVGVQGAREVEAAEAGLVAAQENVRRSLETLHAAREQALRDLQDLKDASKDDVRSVEGAQIALIEAEQRLTAVRASALPDSLELRKAQLDVADAVNAVSDAKRQQARDTKDLAKAEKDGTNGSAGVKTARQQVADARTAAAKARKDLAQTRHDADLAHADAARTVARAEQSLSQARSDAARSVSRAEMNLARARTDGAKQVANAQRQLAVANARVAAAQAKVDDADKKRAGILGQMGPQQKTLIAGIALLKKEWNGFLADVSKPVANAALDGIHAIGKALPALEQVVKPVERALGGVFRSFGDAAGSKGFKTFAADFGKFSASMIGDAGKGTLNLAKGFGGMLRAFMPLSTDMSKGLVDLTQKFSAWGAGLSSNKGFQKFITYVRKEGPVVLQVLGDIVKIIGKTLEGLAPLGGAMLSGLKSAFGFLADLSPKTLGAIATTILAVWGALKLWALGTKLVEGAQWLLNAALDANPIGLVVLAIGALVAGFILAYKHSKTFRAIVDGALNSVKDAGKAVGKWFSDHFVPFFTQTLPGAFHATLAWVKKNWPWILGALTGPIGLVTVFIVKHWDTITGAFTAAKNWVVGKFKTAWSAITDVIMSPIRSARDKISDIFGKNGPIRSAFSNAVAAIGSIWKGMEALAAKPVNFIIGTVYNNGIRKALNKLPEVHLSKAALIGGFATGGYTGPGGKYEPAGIVHKGEFVHDKETTNRARPVLEALHRTKGKMFGYSQGGPVAGSTGLEWAHAASFAKSQVGKPYVWGGVGPGGYDCSGFMSAITNVLRGLNPHYRVGATSSFPWPGFVRGPGEFTIGSTNHYPGSSVGHMAGTLRGMNVESRGGVGVITGPKARGYNDHGFNKVYHIGASGNFGHGGGGSMGNPLSGLHIGKWAQELKGMGGYGPTLAAIPGHLAGGLAGFVKKKISQAIGVVGDALSGGAGPSSGGQGTAQWAPTVRMVLTALGQSEGLTGSVLRRMGQESGGNPRAVNKTDSNWRAGHPSVGLMQVIRGTYASNRPHPDHGGPRLYGVPINPYDNIYAGIKHAMTAYPGRSLASVMGQPGGYDSGGYLPPGLSTVYNGTSKPEPVFTSGQWADIHQVATQGGNTGTGRSVNLNGPIYSYDYQGLVRKIEQADRLRNALAGMP